MLEAMRRGKRSPGNCLVAVAIDKDDSSSQIALKWAVENLLSEGHPVLLIHVIHTKSSYYSSSVSELSDTELAIGSPRYPVEKYINELFLRFRIFCARKDIPCLEITLDDADVAKALVWFVNFAAIDNLVLGAASGGFLRRLMHSDVPSEVQKKAPDFCTIHVVPKGKISSIRNALHSPPHFSPLHKRLESLVKENSSKSPTRVRRTEVNSFNDLDIDCDNKLSISAERAGVDQTS